MSLQGAVGSPPDPRTEIRPWPSDPSIGLVADSQHSVDLVETEGVEDPQAHLAIVLYPFGT